jgi:hypothetical protein
VRPLLTNSLKIHSHRYFFTAGPNQTGQVLRFGLSPSLEK